jgi:hypothetical protein
LDQFKFVISNLNYNKIIMKSHTLFNNTDEILEVLNFPNYNNLEFNRSSLPIKISTNLSQNYSSRKSLLLNDKDDFCKNDLHIKILKNLKLSNITIIKEEVGSNSSINFKNIPESVKEDNNILLGKFSDENMLNYEGNCDNNIFKKRKFSCYLESHQNLSIQNNYSMPNNYPAAENIFPPNKKFKINNQNNTKQITISTFFKK